MKALEIATSLKIPWQDFKASNGWAVGFMCRKGLALHRRTTLAKKLPTDYVEKLIAYQRHIINLHRKHNYLLGQMGMKPQSFLICRPTLQLIQKVQNQYLSKQQDMEN
jgi:hypothetical protein